MEKALMLWFDDCSDKHIPLSSYAIRQKALQIHNHLKSSGSAEQRNASFQASKGWLDKLTKRYNLHSIKLQGEKASADTEAADKFKEEIMEIIEKEDYCKDQIFNADETALYWRKLPSRTYLYKDQRHAFGFKAFKECITILMCSNVVGNCLLKPLVIHNSAHPRVMKNNDMSKLPVIWHNNKKAWMTADIFKDWFFNDFVPSVENHMRKRNLSFKAVLIIDNATSHSKDLQHPNIKVVFLPPNCTSLIQPLDQGIIHAFKAIYIRLYMQTIRDELDKDKNKTVTEAWEAFSIKDCINTISLAYKELKTSTLNAC